MNSTRSALFAAVAFAVLVTPALASGRHDERAHGYDKARAMAMAQEQAAKPAYLGVGPRAQDTPLRNVPLRPLAPKTKSASAPR